MKEWYFNKDDYKEINKIFPIKNSRIKSMVGVKFLLPFHLPLKDNSRLIINYKKINLSVIIKHHKIKRYIYDELSFDDIKTEVEITIFKRIPVSTSEEDIENNKEITLALEFLNHFIKSIKVKYDYQNLRIIARQDLPQIIPLRIHKTTSFKSKHIKDYGIFNDHFKAIPSYHDEINRDEEINLVAFVTLNDQNPYVNSIYYIRRANDLITDGDYQFGVLSLETGIEMFMYTLFKEILEYKNFTEKDIENKLQAGYKNILNEHLKKSFDKEGYTFSFSREDNENNLLYGYYEKVYTLRNKIIHEGYYCSEDEAVTAGETGLEVIKNVVDAINNSELQKSAFRGEPLLY